MNSRHVIFALYALCFVSVIGIFRVILQNILISDVEWDPSPKTFLPQPKPWNLEKPHGLITEPNKRFNILFWNNYFHYSRFGMGLYNEGFLSRKCSFTNCFTCNIQSKWKKENFDAIVFHGLAGSLNVKEMAMLKSARESGKITSLFVLFILESPANNPGFLDPVYKDFFDIVYSYRRDSEVYFPYGKVLPRSSSQNPFDDKLVNKTKGIAWFVSHCSTESKREDYAKELGLYLKDLSIDIFGACGPNKLPSPSDSSDVSLIEKERLGLFTEGLKDYKFYLAFENSKCKDYITEKLFYSLSVPNVIPIVLGTNRSEYEAVAPPKSFIHVDDFKSPKELAHYLETLNTNFKEFSLYQEWRNHFYVDVPYDSAPCDFCRVLNERANDMPVKPIHDINDHWVTNKCFN